MSKTFFTVTEVSRMTGLNREQITTWIERQWVTPPEPTHLDREDVARLELIHDMIDDFGANEEAIPVILHLVDQLYGLREELRRHAAGQPAGSKREARP